MSVASFIFDIGNVIIPFDFNRAIRRIAAECVDPFTQLPPEAHNLTSLYESGRLKRPEFLEQAMELLRYRGTEGNFVAAWQDIFEENPPMNRLIGRLRACYPLYLLSNTSDIHADYFEAKYPVFSHFSGSVYSHLAGCMKPERVIFEKAIEKFGVDPAQTVYVDDLAANVAGASAAGFVAIQYDHTRHADFVARLRELGVQGLEE
ncbi:MAG: HAD family hydrolase [Chthoniobacteraceae bacterium]